MNKALNQKISQFLDDDLDVDGALYLLQKIQSDADTANTLKRYQAVSHALKTNQFLMANTDFSAKIIAQIEQEAFYLSPKHKPTITHNRKLIALAASIAVIAVLTARGINNPNPLSTLQVATQQHTEQASKSVNYAHLSGSNQEQYPLNKRINDYLQAHNNSVYTQGEADLAPLSRVTAYQQK
ncbi:MAG: sigma-E factor negative regulatory protein [Methylovulum sp.]|nr:sigma-E factor negative regulatory protein [Methylovulum sp.]